MEQDKHLRRGFFGASLALALSSAAMGQDASQTKELGVVVVTSGHPSSLPTHIPTTMESVTAKQIAETINATDSEDALKYLPSLSVRKRYIGDYNHAVLASRASGANNPARSAVYADGILLSNYLGNSATNAPRWGLVTPEEIERVDVMYGPFSAAYPGNSVGAVVDYVTRMPTAFEAHMKVSAFNQHFDAYNTNSHFGGANASVTLGSKVGDWSYWFNVNRLDSSGQPMVFVRATPTTGVTGTRVNGIVSALSTTGTALDVLGTTTQYHTVQDHAKLKLAYDLSSTLRASYTLGYWQNTSNGSPATYLRDASTGAAVYTGTVNNGVNAYSVPAFTASQEALTHVMHGLSLKSNTQGVFDWEMKASLYNYQTDLNRASGTQSSDTTYSSAGKITDQSGTGWNNLALKGTWRPEGVKGTHVVDFGLQQDHYTLKTLTQNTGINWEAAAPASLASKAGGKTEMQSLYAQDAWRFAPLWKTVLGLRAEDWKAHSGDVATATSSSSYASRQETHFSPKAAISHQWAPDLLLKASTGRSLRMPTTQEMYGNTSLSGSTTTFLNDPNLRPERSWTSELTAEKDSGSGLWRVTAFFENTRDAIYSQTNTFSDGSSRTFVQNIKRIESSGLEVAYAGNDVLTRGLDLLGSVTYVDSRIKENDGYVVSAGDTINQYQPRVPAWRGNVLANYRWDDTLSTSIGARYSGHQFGSLNNADSNGYSYTGVSKFFVVDARAVYKVDRQWTVAGGIDNLNNYKYWNYHLYPMRTFFAELKYDLT
ncbi:TonB-dependent receptor [Limnohabitans sp. JirII-29]|uniref:TonB-dependent receptor n=1 Tax=Limnohabitans sp. JirII-29 TaxID=1835756 RepID=UPI000D351523|nr:TonB-dependent receptor [Limnohabitans sp. JirII-29]PUE29043.1 TonB-dependent receptor [Limnohabitans sp. JirII-29]